jgi:hypothetical protein
MHWTVWSRADFRAHDQDGSNLIGRRSGVVMILRLVRTQKVKRAQSLDEGEVASALWTSSISSVTWNGLNRNASRPSWLDRTIE